MKHTHIQHLRTLALIGAMAAALCGCQKDDLAPQAGSNPQGELQITVTDGGYTGNAITYSNGTWSEQPPTRATENGYKTTFTEGDQVGFYAVKSGALTATNVCLTLTSGVWTPPDGTKLPADADRYFVYYPYKSSPGTVTNAATDADAFFANVIAAWALTTNQSGTNYTAKDLMVGSGTLGATPVNGKYPLNVTLTHKMGLAVIKLPGGVTSITFNGFTPYTVTANSEYRYLVKPATSSKLIGTFVDGGEARGYIINATIEAGKYKTYNVQGKPRYAIGDPYPDATNPIGVVFWLDENDPTYNPANKKGLKGKIVSLDEPIENWNSGNEAGKLKWSTEQVTTGATSTSDGAANTIAITQTANYSSTVYPAVAWCVEKNTGGVTGWYLPAKDELLTLYYVITTVNSSLQTVGATELSPRQYWSSTEDDSTYSFAVHFGGGTTYSTQKRSTYNLRCVREVTP